jgi:hypothetical protein
VVHLATGMTSLELQREETSPRDEASIKLVSRSTTLLSPPDIHLQHPIHSYNYDSSYSDTAIKE